MSGQLVHLADDWYEWRQRPPLAAQVNVQIGVDDGGRLQVIGMRLLGDLTSAVLRSVPIGRIEAAANAHLHVGDEGVRPVTTTRRRRPLDPRLADPGGNRPDSFYEDVARRYRDLSHRSSRPALDLAEANRVPASTAYRWIKEARRRGLLAPGRPGKVG